jgi:hypothetical protein
MIRPEAAMPKNPTSVMMRPGPLTRWGRCQVGHHWTRMRPVKEADLTDGERRDLHKRAGE